MYVIIDTPYNFYLVKTAITGFILTSIISRPLDIGTVLTPSRHSPSGPVRRITGAPIPDVLIGTF